MRDINPYNFEPLAKKVTDSINYEELAAASAYVDPEQPPVLQTLDPNCMRHNTPFYISNKGNMEHVTQVKQGHSGVFEVFVWQR